MEVLARSSLRLSNTWEPAGELQFFLRSRHCKKIKRSHIADIARIKFLAITQRCGKRAFSDRLLNNIIAALLLMDTLPDKAR
jgi:hypothetical protein